MDHPLPPSRANKAAYNEGCRLQREQRSSCCSSCPWQLTEGFGARVFMSISCEICYAPYFIHFLFPRSLHDNQRGIVRFICFCQTLADNHVNVHDDISLHFISARGVCVCVSVHLYFSVEKTAYQLEINFRRFSEKTNCAVGEKGVCVRVCV